MGRSTKLIFIILLLCLMIYPMFSTCYMAVGNPSKSSNSQYTSNTVTNDEFNGITPPEKPDGEMMEDEFPNGVIPEDEIPEMPDDLDEDNMDDFNNNEGIILDNNIPKYIYHINPTYAFLLIIEAFLFAILLSYLIFTDFCKKDIKTVFSENKAIAYSYTLISFCVGHAISFGLLYLIQNIISNRY